jgi:hypothetical protein
MGANEGITLASTAQGVASRRGLSAMLSQVLVAFTVEFDNEFERRMGEAGYPGARLSLVVWNNLMRFVAEGGLSVRDLAAQALAPDKQIKFELGCLERWGFVVLKPDLTDDLPYPTRAHRQSGRELREGWGSGRGIRVDSMVRLTSKGLTASEIWPPLFDAIERRWEVRFGKEQVSRLRGSLQGLLDRRSGDGSPISQGMVAPQGTVRAGDQAPALGRRDVGTAARQRMRDLVAQTEAFVHDPAGALPHYPLWDMNRGFGP